MATEIEEAQSTKVSKVNTRTTGNTLCINEGSLGFTLTNVDGERSRVEVNFLRPAEADSWPLIFSSKPFQSWAEMYEKNDQLILNSVTIQSVLIKGNEVKTLTIDPSVTKRSNNEIIMLPREIILREQCNSAGVLAILRCTFREESRRANSSLPWSRDFVLFYCTSRPAVAKTENMEIMSGYFGANGEFCGESAKILASTLKIKIHKSDVVYLTAKQKGILTDPSHINEVVHLYLYRQNISEEEIEAIPRVNPQNMGKTNDLCLKMASLGDAWKVTTDAKSIAALFLFHEFRYHRMMPKYRPPREAVKQTDNNYEKRKPEFTCVDNLYPSAVGANLRVKVHIPPDHAKVTEVSRRDGKVKQANAVVGDESGVVNMRLSGNQLNIPDIWKAGTCLSIHNAKIDMVNDFMLLYVDKWGKINVAGPSEAGFEFKVEATNNKSEIEYELVGCSEGSGGNSPEERENVDYSRHMQARGGYNRRGNVRGGGAAGDSSRGKGRGRVMRTRN